MKLVYVEWSDSYGCGSLWQTLEDVDPGVIVCKSVGWLIADNKTHITLVPHIHIGTEISEAQGCGDMTIPKTSILKRKNLSI